MRTVWVLVGLLVLCGCGGGKKRAGQPRILHLSIAADEEFRARPEWEHLIHERVQRISRVWEEQVGIRWEVGVVNPWVTENTATAEALRAALGGGTPGGSTLLVGISGQAHAGDSLGSVAPFTKVLVVYDFPQKSEEANTAILSHQLARLFGAWETPTGNSVMNTQPATLAFDDTTAEVIRLTKDLDFQAGIAGIDPTKVETIAKRYAATKGDAARNPILQAHIRAGEDLLSTRSPEGALSELRKAAAMDAANPRLHDDMGVALAALNELPSAIQQFREVVRLQPNSAVAHANLGAALTRAGNWQEANAEVRKAVELSPHNADLRFTMGSVLLHAPGQLDAAIAQVKEGLRLSPDSTVGKSLLQGAEQARAHPVQ